MLRAVARVISSIILKSFKAILINPTVDSIEKAENFLIKTEQKHLDMNWEHKYKRLGPNLENGIILVGERIANWLKNNWNQNKFILMPLNSKLMKLYIQYLHKMDHGGIESTLAKLQSKFWLIGARKMIRSVKNKCVTCRRAKAKTVQQSMGQINPDRLKPAPPFHFTSCDLFGPFFIKDTVKRRTYGKAYGIIFTCLVTRAVYIDLSESYDTVGFLTVFRRFVTIRGYPRKVYSDQGSQLVSASKELKLMMPNIDLNNIATSCTSYGTQWVFNKSADAPWQNGCSEALIKSIKRSLAASIGDNKLTFGEMQTALFEVANLLNERPIGIKPGLDIELGSYLCPNDLLLGRTNIKAPPDMYSKDKNYKYRLEFMERILNSFWKKWHRDFFPTLIIRQKWHVDKRNMCVGDIVLVKDSNAIRGQWRLAQVIAVESSRDGKVRDVTLRYKLQKPGKMYTGLDDICIKRSVHRLIVLLPVEEFASK